ncbi:hypothetical protein AX774_g5257 [Zancudomyces culisetae]|uniref:Uncharacterized protein n=1 Tax=Zancudomyces culisetae TaxID=1213189 RepID=A0A1R1PJZ2_ZANCU|nr:hypothetical protein AX774_g5257 [Zancudomyces culisetae]|eukprot:OMH81285.1 hypothetical protein AX774_g5257 [Zancudomyces culisetae]
MKLNVNVLLNTILNISIASSSILRAPEGSEVGNFAQFARRKYENLKPVNKRWNPVSCSLNKRSNYTKREDADTGVGNADTGVGNARVSSQEMFDNYLKYYGLYGLDIDMTPYKEVYDAVRLPKQIFWMVFGLLWAVYVVVTTLLPARYKRKCAKIYFGNKTEDKKNEMTRKAQFEGLLSYYSGFVRLMYSASISFCPENAEFLKDYQALKYVVCSYLSSELEMSKASKKGGNYSSSKEYSNVNLSGDPAKDENGDSLDLFELIDLNMLISGDVVPPLPGTIAEAVYKMQLMPILNKINEGEGVVGRTTSKQTKVPKKLVYRFRGIYLKYLEKDALLDIELSEKSILTSITEQAKKENYTLSIFDKVLEDVLKSLYENTYPVMLEKL